MIRYQHMILQLVLMVLASSCATVFSPPGGPTDETPPKNLSVEPEMLAKNVKTKKFVFEFDEFIKLNNPYNEVLISPPLNNKPDYKIKGKKLIVTLNDTLQENTTYTINFGSAIQDNNEGNKLVGLNYVFSTGNQIDSLSIGGKIKDAFSNKGAEGVGILLYDAKTFTDSTFQTKKPVYYAISNSSGNFQFKYLRPGEFKVLALKDQNFNIQYDPPGEQIGFLDSSITLSPDNQISLSLKLFANEPEQQILLYNIDKQNVITLNFNKNVNEFKLLKVSGLEEEIGQIWNDNRDSLKLYYLYSTEERPELIVNYGEDISDTLLFRTEIFTKDSVKNLESIWESSKKEEIPLDLGKPIVLNFKRAIQLPSSGIYLYEDSFKREKQFNLEVDAKNPSRLLIKSNYKPETRYDIVLTDSAVVDYYGIGNTAFKLSYTTKLKEDYGNLHYLLTELDSTQQYVLEVLKDGKVKEKFLLKNQSEFEKDWKLLLPGKLQFRLIWDKDRNGTWTTGSIDKKTQPEPIYVYPDEVKIRANWDLEVEDKPSFNLH